MILKQRKRNTNTMYIQEYITHNLFRAPPFRASHILRIMYRKWFMRREFLLLTSLLILLTYYMYQPEPAGYISSATKRIVSIGPTEVRIMEGGDLRLRVQDNNKTLLRITVGYFLPYSTPQVYTISKNSLSFVWHEGIQLDLSHEALERGRRFNVSWTVTNPKYTVLKDVISLQSYHWYGGTLINKLTWPIETWDTKLMPFITGDNTMGIFGNIVERYWLSSAGIALVVHRNNPLFVQFNRKERTMTFVSRWKAPYRTDNPGPLKLTYSIYQAEDIMAVHNLTRKLVFERPKKIPDTLVMRYPIWTTWIVYKWFVNQTKVVQYAKNIHHYGFNASQIEIDDDWTPSYGDLDFDPLKFEDPAEMVKAIQKYNFRVTLWVPPFCSLRSDACALPKIWVQGSWTSIVSWWNGYGRLLDATNPLAERWFKSQLNRLRIKYNISSFKFDAGEASYLPSGYKTYKRLESPNDYTQYYAEMAARIDSNVRALEIRAASNTQHLPIYTRLMDKETSWGYDNGLKTLIPHAILAGLLGYAFIIPDIIGGNEYNFHQLDKELFIRWLQASVFMPVLQFSKPPWYFDDEAVIITKNMTRLHLEYSDYIIKLAHEFIKTGDPIIRPIWWNAPRDETALVIDDQFLLGDKILVAPVLEPNARSRNVYLPKGQWQRNGEPYTGPGWLRDQPAELKDIIYFHRIDLPTFT